MGIPHIPLTITYTTYDTALKNKRKSNNAQHLVTCVHTGIKNAKKESLNLIPTVAGDQYSYEGAPQQELI